MARGNLFLGQARGKVGSVVFARAFGQQITRTRPTSVANPKSYAQNVQRAVLATVAKEAALLTPIVDHSFANVAYGAESVRHFRKLNMGILRNMFIGGTSNMNLSAKGAGAVPNALKMSEGSLPAFSSAYQDDIVCFYQGPALGSISEVDVETFRAAYPFIQGGDQLTLVKIVRTGGTLDDGNATFALKVDRVVFAPNAFDDPSAMVILDDATLNPQLLDLTKTTNTECIKGIEGGGGKGLGCDTADDKTYAAALILSRKVNNAWQRSTQYLEMTNYDDWTDVALAIESYGASSSLVEETEYLNQADESTPASGVNGAYANAIIMVNGEEALNQPCNAGAVRAESASIPASGNFSIKIVGFGTSNARLVTCGIQKPDGTLLAHGTNSARWSANWQASLAGQYIAIAVFADGTRSEFDITLSQAS